MLTTRASPSEPESIWKLFLDITLEKKCLSSDTYKYWRCICIFEECCPDILGKQCQPEREGRVADLHRCHSECLTTGACLARKHTSRALLQSPLVLENFCSHCLATMSTSTIIVSMLFFCMLGFYWLFIIQISFMLVWRRGCGLYHSKVCISFFEECICGTYSFHWEHLPLRIG